MYLVGLGRLLFVERPAWIPKDAFVGRCIYRRISRPTSPDKIHGHGVWALVKGGAVMVEAGRPRLGLVKA